MITTFSYVLLITGILVVASLGGFIAEKGGIINFAIEGYMIVGALSYVFISQRVAITTAGDDPYNQIWIVVVAGFIAAFASTLHAAASIRFRADQVISSIAFNMLALGLAVFLINTSTNLTGGSAAKQGYEGPLAIGANTSEWQYILSMPVFFAIVIAIIVIIFYKKSKLGYKIRSVGNNPTAAASVGIKVNRIRTYAVMLSGLLGGMAGAMFTTYNSFFNGQVQGLGFLAVSIWILGQWRPAWIVLAASIFGFSFGIARRITTLPGAENFIWYPPQGMLAMIPFVLSIVTLIALSFISKRSFVPKAIGIPYIRGGEKA